MTLSPDVLILVDLEGRIVMCNSTVKRMFGYSEHEVLNHKSDMLVVDMQTDTKNGEKPFEIPEREGFHKVFATGKNKKNAT